MKCPKCKFYNICKGRLNETVENCVRFKSVEQTNEEWLHQCNREQLAEELLAWWFDGANTYSQFGLFKWEIDEAKDKITKWLKEKHNG